MAEFYRKDRLVPTCLLGQLVVSQDVSPYLILRQVFKADRRHSRYAQELSRTQPTMACNYVVLLINENRVREAKCLDAVGDLADLFLGMGASVSRIRRKVSDALVDDR